MPVENAIELFNCSLCSFCETSLDRLACHIRRHIKPEPMDSSCSISLKDHSSIVTPRVHTNGSNNCNEAYESSTQQRNGDEPITDCFNRRDDDPPNNESNRSNTSSNIMSPRIEVINPRTLTTSDPNSDVLSVEAIPHIQLQKGNYIPPPPPLIEKSPQLSPYSRGYTAQPVRYSNSNQVPNRHESPQGARYVQLYPREPPYHEIKSTRSYNPQYAAGKYIHADLIPIAPANINNFKEMQAISLDGHVNGSVDVYRKNTPNGERGGTVQKVPNRSGSNPVPASNVGRQRADQHFDVNKHYNYQGRPIKPNDDTYRPNAAPNQLNHLPQQPKEALSPNRHGQRQLASYLVPVQNSTVMPELQSQQLQTRIASVQYSDMMKQKTSTPIGVPNNGTVILNPDQLLSVTGNPPLDQLAGLLVVPLKKTCEIATQTEPVDIKSHDRSNVGNTNTCSVQTELRMGQISEVHSKSTVPIFGSFRSTDALYECLVCGEEFASDHHLQEHVSNVHTHVCEKCYHSSTNINDHNAHVQECGNLHAEMLCVECNSSFTSLKKFNLHRSKMHNVRMPFRCGICNVPFESHEAVMKHISTHDTNIHEFKCRYCIKVFQSPEALSKHCIRHKGVEVLHECRFCKKSFSTGKLLQDHISYVHVIKEPKGTTNGDVVYAEASNPRPAGISENSNISSKKHPLCHHCDLAFKNRDLLRRHVDVCSKNSDAKVSAFICDVCKEYFSTDIQRKHHLKQEHRRQNGYRCPKCSKIYRTWSRLKFHTKQQHLKKTCPDCSMIFTKEHVLRKHQEDMHGKPQGQPGERVYTCSLCNTMLNTLTGLMNHRRDVHPELSQMKTADQSSSATMLSTIDNYNYDEDDAMLSVSNCVECNEIFTSNKMLNNHMQEKHSKVDKNQSKDKSLSKLEKSPFKFKDSPYKCEKCESTFDDEKRLKNHLGLIHGEKPFNCNVCEKKFQYSSQVIWHMRCHRKKGSNFSKNARPLWKSKPGKFSAVHKKTTPSYICQFCGAKFKQEKLLKNHKGAVHKIKLFVCEICNFKFGHSTELIWHSRTCRTKYKRQNPDLGLPSPRNDILMASGGELTNANGFDVENDYMCHICESTFKHSHEYLKHMDSHVENDEKDSSSKLDANDYIHPRERASPPSSANGNQSSQMRSPNERISIPRLKSPPSSHSLFNSGDMELMLKHEPEFDPNVGEYACPICRKSTRSVTGMKTHYGRVHGVWGKETSHIEEGDGREVTIFPCKNCDQEFSSFSSLSDHTTNIHGFTIREEDVDVETRHEFIKSDLDQTNAIFTCPHCHISFDNTKAIRVHAFKKHGMLLNDNNLREWRTDQNMKGEAVGVTQDQLLRYKCQRCKAKFRTTKAIRIHTFKRHGFVLSKKELAKSKAWIPKSELIKQPINRNKGKDLIEEPNPCDKCGRVFGNYRALFTHYRQAHRVFQETPFVPRKPSRTELTMKFESHTVKEDVDATDSSSTITSHHNSLSTTSSGVTAESVDCPKCNRSFTVHKSLVAHLYSAHRIAKDQYPTFWPNGMPILPRVSSNCPTCNKECVDDRAMRIHMFKAHGTHYRDLQKSIEIAADESFLNGIDDNNVDDMPFDENELRVVEDIKGPPVCFICGRLFKNRRALMTHEHKFHGIRWVGRKRIFPQQVRNLPSLDKLHPPVASTNSTKRIFTSTKTTKSINGPSRKLVNRSNVGYQCPECETRYHNRRAITTHLCRIHRYKRDDIHAFFRNNVPKPISERNSNDTEAPDATSDDMSDNLVIVETSDLEDNDELNIDEDELETSAVHNDKSDAEVKPRSGDRNQLLVGDVHPGKANMSNDETTENIVFT